MAPSFGRGAPAPKLVTTCTVFDTVSILTYKGLIEAIANYVSVTERYYGGGVPVLKPVYHCTAGHQRAALAC